MESTIISKLTAKRGDHATGWYRIGNRAANLNHSDWCVFDEKGYLGCNSDGKPICWTTKNVAQYNADNYPDTFIVWAEPIADPFTRK